MNNDIYYDCSAIKLENNKKRSQVQKHSLIFFAVVNHIIYKRVYIWYIEFKEIQ